jgi:purine-nucleoside phosphorylase
MVIADHINMTGRHPLIGPNADELGPRFADRTSVGDAGLRVALLAAGRDEGVPLAEGVYVCLTGPTYETPAEVRMLRTFGADAVGMSTGLEAVAAHWCGLRVCGVSLVTNAAAGLGPVELTHEDVLAAADAAGPRLASVLSRFLAELSAS